ncbi:nuclear pore complex protein Nup93-like [Schistocerca gregaria]|uniref:nuclear pore complex protein Nup93-like n=1 Tax=Schistocerca gregaria TaxID=7010 RepID=UPI00211DDD07|nr:nuclear pore complex protein Nup93-like [Schistocerca gregaria]
MGKSAGLEKLVQRSQKLNQIVDNPSVSHILRNTRQLHDDSVLLARRHSIDEQTKNKAQYLLMKRGYDLERSQRDLNAIDIRSTLESVETCYETDLEGYLQHEHEALLLTAIEEAKKETVEYFSTNFSAYMNGEWEETKKELIEFFNQKESILRDAKPSKFAPDSEAQLSSLASGYATEDRGYGHFTRKMYEYSRVVYQLNESRLQKRQFDLVSQFYNTALSVDEGNKYQLKDLLNCWRLIQKILHEEDPATRELMTDLGAKPEDVSDLHRRWLNGAREFLEEQHWNWVQSCVSQNLQIARMGTKPTTEEYVKAFINVLNIEFPEHYEKTGEGQPLWVVIYYTIRSGDLSMAYEIASRNASSSGTFLHYLKNYMDNGDQRCVCEDLRAQVLADYLKLLRQSKDPYKHVVYNLLGRCDPHRSHEDLYRCNMEDYMWIKLNMVSFDVQEHGTMNSGSQLTLKQLQSKLRECGPDRFKNPILYFQVLLASLQFERAIWYLKSTELYPIEAFHFALALYYYSALRCPSSPFVAPLFGEENGFVYFNFVRRLHQYIGQFVHSNILMALHYLCLIKGKHIQNISIRNLVIETREFSALLGSFQPDGSFKPGYLEKFVEPDQWREIVQLAAATSEEDGKYEDAIKLFDLAQCHEKSVEIITKQLACVMIAQSSERDSLIALANSLAKKYQDEHATGQIEPRRRHAWDAALHSFLLLLGLCKFFDLYKNGNYTQALESMHHLGLVAQNHHELEAKLEAFNRLGDNVKRNFAEILLANMDCIYRTFMQVKREGLNPEREAFLHSLKLEAKTLITFSGMIRFRIPGDVSSRFIRMEAEMT